MVAKCNLIVISHFLKVTEKIKSNLSAICTMKEKVATGHALQHAKFQPDIRKKNVFMRVVKHWNKFV